MHASSAAQPPQRVCPHCSTIARTTEPRCPFCHRSYRRRSPLGAFAAGLVLAVAATLAGVALPGAVWFLALGPLPTSLVSFAQLYGYSARVAATGLAVSFASALALFPLALSLAH